MKPEPFVKWDQNQGTYLAIALGIPYFLTLFANITPSVCLVSPVCTLSALRRPMDWGRSGMGRGALMCEV